MRLAPHRRSAALPIALVLPLLVAGLALGRVARAEVGGLSTCDASTAVGSDTLAASGSTQWIRLSRGLAQSFVAQDTLIRSVALWLPGSRRLLSAPIHLYLVRAGDDGRPQPASVLVDGPALLAGSGSDLRPSRFDFVFDPPISLPHPGRYALVVVSDGCQLVPVLSDPGDSYAGGEVWEVGKRSCDGPAMSLQSRVAGTDLLFQVQFCDGGTVATGNTWGEIKTHYR